MPRLTARRKHVESSPSAAAVKTNNNNNNDEPRPKLARIGLCLPVPQRPKDIGSVLVCGQGDLGQLGLGEDDTKFERKRPALVTGVSSVVDICAGGVHNLVLTSDGKVFSFGCNDEGALGRDTSKEGSEFEPGEVKLPGKGVMLSAGDSHSACLLEDGRVFAWGSFRDSHGSMGLTMDGNKREPINLLEGYTCVAIGSGTDHLVILTSVGKVFTIGCGEQGQLGRVSLRSASGETRRGKTQMLKPCEVITRTHKPIVQIWVTKYCTFMREFKSDLIWAFGLNNYQQLVPKKSVDISSCPVLTKLSDVKQIAGGQHHTLVLSKAGTVHVIGRHDYGRLGLGTVEGDLTELRQVEKLAKQKISMISCGESQSFAIDGDGKLYAWGMGSSHQLGTGVDEDSLEPELIESKQTKDKRIINVSSGGQHSIFLATDIITKVNGASNAKETTGKAAAKEAKETATTENAEKKKK